MARSENSHAAICMVASMAGFGLNDAFIKLVGQDLPLFQAVFLRGLMATFLIGILAARDGGARFRPSRSDRRLISLRTAAEIGATVCFLTALFHMPIANASAIVQSVPLAVTLAAAAFMGEPVGWRRYVAIGVGFAGVLVIARPGTDGFNVYALWALASVGCIVLRDLSTRRLSPDTSALGVSLVTSAALTLVAGLAALFGDWAPIAPAHFALLGIAAVGLLVGYVFSVHAMRRGDIGFVQPFRYSLLVFAIINGIVLFGEWPDVWTLVGAAMVAGTGLYTLHRERAATNAPPATLRERRG